MQEPNRVNSPAPHRHMAHSTEFATHMGLWQYAT